MTSPVLSFRFLTPFLGSDRIKSILRELSRAIVSAIDGTDAQREYIPLVLSSLLKWKNRFRYLAKIAYDWCSVIYENHQCFEDWKTLLFLCLEIGFRHTDHVTWYDQDLLIHTEHHHKLIDVVFKSQDVEAITDLLWAWTTGSSLLRPEHTKLLDICAGYLDTLRNLVPFSPRLQQRVIHFIELIDFRRLEVLGVEGFAEFLNHLHVALEDMRTWAGWIQLLVDTLQTPDGARCLSHRYWELLLELLVMHDRAPLDTTLICDPRIMTYLIDAQEWDKLECWMAFVWMVWPPGADGMTEEDMERSMLLLFRQRPGAAQKLEQWMKRWSHNREQWETWFSQERARDICVSFRRLHRQTNEAAQRYVP